MGRFIFVWTLQIHRKPLMDFKLAYPAPRTTISKKLKTQRLRGQTSHGPFSFSKILTCQIWLHWFSLWTYAKSRPCGDPWVPQKQSLLFLASGGYHPSVHPVRWSFQSGVNTVPTFQHLPTTCLSLVGPTDSAGQATKVPGKVTYRGFQAMGKHPKIHVIFGFYRNSTW